MEGITLSSQLEKKI